MILNMSYKPIIREPVSYKEQKKSSELMAKYRVILQVKKDKYSRWVVSKEIGQKILDIYEKRMSVNIENMVECERKILSH